jgi:hypothetical protein
MKYDNLALRSIAFVMIWMIVGLFGAIYFAATHVSPIFWFAAAPVVALGLLAVAINYDAWANPL